MSDEQTPMDDTSQPERDPRSKGVYLDTNWSINTDENTLPIIDKDTKMVSSMAIGVLPTDGKRASEQLETFPDEAEPAESAKQLSAWTRSLTEAFTFTHFGDSYNDVTTREGASWQQKVDHEGVNIGMAKAVAGGGYSSKLSGRKAIERVTSALSSGQSISVPLWHSGFWVTIKSPSLAKRIELDRRVAIDREEAGRKTRGLSFSNDAVYLNDALIGAVIGDVVDSNLKGWSSEKLLEHIKLPDLQLLALAYSTAIFRDGFPLEQPCLADVEECNHVTKATLSIPKLLRVDQTLLSKSQRKMMSDRLAVVDGDKLEHYQDQFPDNPHDRIELNGVKVIFHMPSLAEHLGSGKQWITGIEQMAEQAFGESLDTGQRHEYIERQTHLTTLRNYRHWIKRIVVDEDTVIDDNDDIDTILDRIADNPDSVDAILTGVRQYIKHCVVALAGVPNYQCPACGSWQNTAAPLQHLIPIDMVSLGFRMQQLNILKMARSRKD